jgi:hypothetical protein
MTDDELREQAIAIITAESQCCTWEMEIAKMMDRLKPIRDIAYNMGYEAGMRKGYEMGMERIRQDTAWRNTGR